jgi:hypothetical protein
MRGRCMPTCQNSSTDNMLNGNAMAQPAYRSCILGDASGTMQLSFEGHRRMEKRIGTH